MVLSLATEAANILPDSYERGGAMKIRCLLHSLMSEIQE
jgi:hypothetical protein